MRHHYALEGYLIDLYFPEYKLAIDENGHKERIKHKETERENAIKHLDCEFIKINSGEENFDINVCITKILNHI